MVPAGAKTSKNGVASSRSRLTTAQFLKMFGVNSLLSVAPTEYVKVAPIPLDVLDVVFPEVAFARRAANKNGRRELDV